ncbi:hypothetical protein WAI453_013072 [Rhynchosporium graminicola]|uniref:DUF7587 domain-containing protein n=1 Tax=Rhynchosporium graminicola TaxID=2792576 RepID=A0A1E1K8K8_9HELO|nr:uncharacterized protein RCO7_10298 [Rhynchosporium commune]
MCSLESSSLEDAFGELSLTQETNQSLVTRTESDEPDGRLSIFEKLQGISANAFSRPVFYRVIDSSSPASASNGGLRARLYPPPSLEKVTRDNMKLVIESHAILSSRKLTPFISTTPDLLRAFNIAGQRVLEGKQQVTIILIDPWKLQDGSYVECNALRLKSGLGTLPKYETEILVWAEIPVGAIFGRRTWSELLRSGLFETLPSLNGSGRQIKLQSFREELLHHLDDFSPSSIATSLAALGMDPSSFAMKQIFEFLLGQVLGFRVHRQLQTIEHQLIADHMSKIVEFDQAAHSLTIIAGKEKLIMYFKQDYISHVNRLQPAFDS